MDNDIVSLIGVASIANRLCRRNYRLDVVHQLPLSLYLMTQCQMKLRHPVTSVAQTLQYVEVARLQEDFDQLLMKLVKSKILMYISSELAQR